MNAEIITSLQNPLIKKWRLLNKSRSARIEQGFFLAEGEHMTQEAISSGYADTIIVSQSAQQKYRALLLSGLPVNILADHVFESLCDAKTPQGILALCKLPNSKSLENLKNRIICLNAVQDPGNVGTILRTMDAAGFTGLLIDDKTADPFSPKVLRSSMGSIFRIPVFTSSDLLSSLSQLQNSSFEIIAGDLHGEPFYNERPVAEKTCIIIGNEGAGISPEVKEKATLRLKLPMVGGAESLNAAVAAAVMMYDDLRKRLTNP